MCLKIINGQLIWPGNRITLADSVIEREATLSLNEAMKAIYSSESLREKVVAFLSVFPICIVKYGENSGTGPNLDVASLEWDGDHDGMLLCLRSDMPITIGPFDPMDELTVRLVSFTPNWILLERNGLYLRIVFPSPIDSSCDDD